MITVEQAKNIIDNYTNKLLSRNILLKNATGFILAEDVISPTNNPPFHQSAMDGYAFNYSSVNLNENIPMIGIAQAGDTNKLMVEPGTAIRIFTGAPIPEGADTVIMQEHVEECGAEIRITTEKTIKGSNVRFAASQIAKGDIAAKAGTKLTPGVIGYLANLGVYEVPVFTTPRVGVIVTGKELVMPGTPLQHGQIYESNSATISAALYEGHIEPAFTFFVDDDENEIAEKIFEGMKNCDILLMTGGVSVGKYDYVTKALEVNNVEKLFHKVSQKPGKPLFFGCKDNKLVFGLPGNPSAVLTCFYEYVVPCIRKMSGMSFNPQNTYQLKLKHATFKKKELTCFLKGRTNAGCVELLDGQESYKLNAFTEADCLVVLNDNKSDFAENEMVEVHKINECWL